MYKALTIAKWFLRHNALDQMINCDVEGISNLKLQKLLYYAQGCYLALYNEPLFEEKIVAWQHGPVVEIVYQEYKKFHANSIKDFGDITETLEARAVEVLKWVYGEFGQYTAWALRNKTHQEDPWKSTPMNFEIDREAIRAYFLEHYVEA